MAQAIYLGRTKHLGFVYRRWGTPPPKGEKRIYPPPHAGGAKTTPEYDWAYEELIAKRGLSPRAAWDAFLTQYPAWCNTDEQEIVKDARAAFYAAMRGRSKKG